MTDPRVFSYYNIDASPDGTEYVLVDDANTTKRVTLSNIAALQGATSMATALAAAPSAGATSVSVDAVPAGLTLNKAWAIIDPWTVQAELRAITGITGTTLTVAALGFSHAADDVVLITTEPTLNVRWFGAVGDNSTNDAPAIQAAVDQMSDGMSLVFVAGTYRITTKITVDAKSDIRLIGQGGTIVNVGCTAFEIDDTASVDVEDMLIQGLIIAGTQNTQTAIDFVGTNSSVRRCWVTENYISGNLVGIRVQAGASGMMIYKNNLTITNTASSIGILVEGSDCKTEGNVIRGFAEGIALDSGSQLCTGNHIFMSPSSSHVTDITIRRDIAAQTSGFVIVFNYLDGQPTTGYLVINAQSARQTTVMGNYFRYTNAAGGPLILFENAGSTSDVQATTITGNITVNVSGGALAAPIVFTGIENDDSLDFHIHSNTWGSSITPYSTAGVVQTGTASGAYVPNPNLGRILELTVTANSTIGVPASNLDGGIGNRMTFIIIQDGTGGWTVAWNSNYLEGWSDTGNTASKRSSITFVWNGTNWEQDGAQSPYVS